MPTKKIVYNGHHGAEGEESHCLWCGAPTKEYSYVVNPGAEPVLKCCCDDHFQKAIALIENDSKYRPAFWVVISIFAIGSWIAIGFNQTTEWSYIPFAGLMGVVFIWPRVLPRYEYYLPLGLMRTRQIVRVVAGALFLFALYLVANSYGLIS